MSDLALFPDLFATPQRFAWHAATRTAVVADMHVGALAGVVGAKMREAWGRMVERGPRRVILAGDVMDDAGAGAGEIEGCRGMLGMLGREKGGGVWGECRVVLTPGNHDGAGLGEKLGVESAAEARVGRYVVSHGHELTASRTEVWVVGHQHPAVVLRGRVQAAKMACYAVCAGSARRPGMVILPAFSSEAGGPVGTNLLTGRNWLLPVARPGAERIRVYGLVEPVGGEARVLDFGPLSDLQG